MSCAFLGIILPMSSTRPITKPDEKILAFGVGITDSTLNLQPTVVQYAEQSMVTRQECVRSYNSLVVSEMNFCGQSINDRTTLWHGDQGGPVINDNCELLGLVSAFGRTTETPTINIDIYAEPILNFITNQLPV